MRIDIWIVKTCFQNSQKDNQNIYKLESSKNFIGNQVSSEEGGNQLHQMNIRIVNTLPKVLQKHGN